jgi:hypothetical protein
MSYFLCIVNNTANVTTSNILYNGGVVQIINQVLEPPQAPSDQGEPSATESASSTEEPQATATDQASPTEESPATATDQASPTEESPATDQAPTDNASS